MSVARNGAAAASIFKDANKADCKAAIETILQHAVEMTPQNRAFAEGIR